MALVNLESAPGLAVPQYMLSDDTGILEAGPIAYDFVVGFNGCLHEDAGSTYDCERKVHATPRGWLQKISVVNKAV